MCHDIRWNKRIADELIREGMLDERSIYVMESMARHVSIQEMADYLNVSRSTVNRTIKELRRKYDDIYKYSDVLPKREQHETKTFVS